MNNNVISGNTINTAVASANIAAASATNSVQVSSIDPSTNTVIWSATTYPTTTYTYSGTTTYLGTAQWYQSSPRLGPTEWEREAKRKWLKRLGVVDEGDIYPIFYGGYPPFSVSTYGSYSLLSDILLSTAPQTWAQRAKLMWETRYDQK